MLPPNPGHFIVTLVYFFINVAVIPAGYPSLSHLLCWILSGLLRNLVPKSTVLVCNLGVVLDFPPVSNQIHYKRHLKNISRLRPSLTDSVAETLIHAFITSHLDYCNVFAELSCLGSHPNLALAAHHPHHNPSSLACSQSCIKYKSSTSPINPSMPWHPSTCLTFSTPSPHPWTYSPLIWIREPMVTGYSVWQPPTTSP